MAPPPAPFFNFFCQLYVGCLSVHVIRQVFIRWEALYVLTLYVLTLYVGKHYMLGSFIRSDVIRSDVIRSVFIRSDVIRSDVIRSVIIRSVGEPSCPSLSFLRSSFPFPLNTSKLESPTPHPFYPLVRILLDMSTYSPSTLLYVL